MLKARPYQIEAFDAAVAAWAEHQSALVVMATGLGKTHLAAMVAKARAHLGRTMMLVHREELLTQAWDTMHEATGERPAIERAEDRANASLFGARAKVVIGTVQTQYSGKGGDGRMTDFDPMDFATLIVDEAHHYIAPSYKRVVEHYKRNPNLRVLGITATPDRADKLAMGRLFDVAPYNFGIRAGVDHGWLVPIDQWTGTLTEMDLSEVGTVAGDLNAEQLAQVMEKHGNCFGVADHTIRRAKGRRTLLFAASVNHAKMLAAILNDRQPDSARYVYEKTGRDERKQMFDDFKRGKFQYLANVGIATEGFNDPGIEVVVVARPTKSRSLYTQMAGRGTRPLPFVVDQWEDAEDRRVAIAESAKPACELVDFVGNAGKHKLVNAADILGGDYDSEVVARVKAKCADAKEAQNITEQLEMEWARLQQEREAAERLEASRVARLRVKSECDFRQVDPFSAAGDYGLTNTRNVPTDRSRRPTPKQLEFLDKFGPKNCAPDELSMGEAGALIATIRERWDKGLCSIDQSKLLKRNGLPEMVPKETAKAWIDRIAASGWRVPTDVRAQALAHMGTQEVTA
jgi:superfamily II DNA or RNA helicase